jgi:glycosyltransferase involved in cell wall biosynthesis
MKKLLFISFYDSSFVKSDIGILEKHFLLENPNLKKYKRNLFGMFLMSIEIFWRVFHSDVVYCWFADFSAFLTVKAASFFHKKVFVVVGGYEVSNLPGYGGLTNKKVARRLKYTLQNATKVIAISDFSKSEIDRLKFGIDPVKINIGVESQKEIYEKTKLIITSGSATKELYQLKGLDIFAQATLGFKKYDLKIIGQYDEEIKKLLLELNPNLCFTGKLEHRDFLEMMKKAKVYCQFSQRESFGLAVLEAMNYGCIPVISKAGAMPEIIGETGFMSEIGNFESATDVLNKAIKSDRSEEIRKRVESIFSIHRREEEIITLIRMEL